MHDDLSRQGCLIRNAQQGDGVLISAVADRAWHHAYRDIYKPEEILKWLVENYSEKILEDHLSRISTDNSYQFLVSVCDNRITGFSEIKAGSGKAELLRIYLDPDFIGKGLGKSMLIIGENWLRTNNIQVLSLAVQKDNSLGLRFYFRNGFEIINSTHGDDLILEKML